MTATALTAWLVLHGCSAENATAVAESITISGADHHRLLAAIAVVESRCRPVRRRERRGGCSVGWAQVYFPRLRCASARALALSRNPLAVARWARRRLRRALRLWKRTSRLRPWWAWYNGGSLRWCRKVSDLHVELSARN